MFSFDRDKDSICAVSTPLGVGAISVVRISGTNAYEITQLIAPFLPLEPESHRVYYGLIHEFQGDVTIDEVLIAYFAKGRSFTGEETLEISCHGSPAITQQVLQNLILAGARSAEKGEFTYRAFSNGRIDLSQAESVLMLIESQSKQSSRLALRQLRGELSKKYQWIENEVIWCLSRLEANIDFSSEDIVIAPQSEIISKGQNILSQIRDLLSSYRKGRIAKEGLRVVLVGAPNVGKSSLLNQLSQENRAIISHIAGTTRDTIEIQIEIDGHRIDLVDTAGIRDSEDEIEKLGIQRTKDAMNSADLVLFILDATVVNHEQILNMKLVCAQQNIVVVNKIDLNPDFVLIDEHVHCSAINGMGLDDLRLNISKFIFSNNTESTPTLMVARQFELLEKMNERMSKALELLYHDASPEFCISELNEVLFSCMELTGRRFDDEVLDRVFKDFCLGK